MELLLAPGFLLFVVIAALLYGSFFIVQQQSRAIIERFGRYHRTAMPGLRIKIPLVDRIVARRWLRIEQMIVTVDTKTKDNVFVKVLVAVQYRIIADKAMESWYQLEDDKAQIQAFVLDVVRAKVPNMELDHVFEKKDEVAQAVKAELTEKMSEFGFEISSALVTDVDPAANVKAAMNEIQTQRRLQEAASAKGEAEKILTVKNAEADAESKRLQGEGIAKQRTAIAQGLRDSVKMVADAAGRQSERGAADRAAHAIFRHHEGHRRVRRQQGDPGPSRTRRHDRCRDAIARQHGHGGGNVERCKEVTAIHPSAIFRR